MVMGKVHIKKAKKYIEAKATGLDKKQAMRYAGYSESASRIPQRLESGQAYSVALSEIRNEQQAIMSKLSEGLTKRIENGEAETLSLDKHMKMLLDVATVHDKLSPKITQHVEQDEEGNTRASKWVTIKS